MSQPGHHLEDPMAKLMPPEIHIPPITFWGKEYPVMDLAMFGLVIILFMLIMVMVRKHLRNPKSKIVTLMEMAVEYIEDQCVSLMGKEGKAYVPFFCTLFTFLLVANMLGLIPWLKSPTASLHVNLGLAVVIFFATHIFGIKKKGFGYFKHFIEPWYAAPIMLPIHVVDEFVKPITLTVRLAINMFSKEILLGAFGFMFTMLVSASSTGEKIMMVLPFTIRAGIILLGVVIGAVQALVFTLLSIVYIAMAIEHHEDHGDEKSHSGEAAHQHA